MTKSKMTKGQAMIYKTLHRKLKIEQYKPIKTELRYSERIISSCSTSGICRATLFTKPVESHEWICVHKTTLKNKRFSLVITTYDIKVMFSSRHIYCTMYQNCTIDIDKEWTLRDRNLWIIHFYEVNVNRIVHIEFNSISIACSCESIFPFFVAITLEKVDLWVRTP